MASAAWKRIAASALGVGDLAVADEPFRERRARGGGDAVAVELDGGEIAAVDVEPD